MIIGDECGPNFLTIVLQLRENPGKIDPPGIEPVPAAWEVTMLLLDHSGGQVYQHQMYLHCMQPGWQVYRCLDYIIIHTTITWYHVIPTLPLWVSCEPKPHSFVYHGWIHKYRIHRHSGANILKTLGGLKKKKKKTDCTKVGLLTK